MVIDELPFTYLIFLAYRQLGTILLIVNRQYQTISNFHPRHHYEVYYTLYLYITLLE